LFFSFQRGACYKKLKARSKSAESEITNKLIAGTSQLIAGANQLIVEIQSGKKREEVSRCNSNE
jgi:hypothetical protein